MIFRHPQGLWLLLGIPVLIVLYLLRPKISSSEVSSLYLWRLSEKYRKRRADNKHAGSRLTLLLQCLTVLTAAMLAGGLTLSVGQGTPEMILILDASASMNRQTGTSQTAFSRAQALALRQISRKPVGGTVSLILAGEDTRLMLEQSGDMEVIRRTIQSAACGFGPDTLDAALTLAQEMLQDNPDAEVILYTDHPCGAAEGMRVEQIDLNGWNGAVLSAQVSAKAGTQTFSAQVVRSGGDGVLTMTLALDGKLEAARRLNCRADEIQTVSWDLPAARWQEAVISIAQEDQLPEDNRFVLFPSDANDRRVLLTGENAYYWQKALEAYPHIRLDTLDAPVPGVNGFDLYLYNGAAPETLPRDGTVWLADLQDDLMTAGISCTLGDEIRGTVGLRQAPDLDVSLSGRLLEGLNLKRIGLYSLRELHSYAGLTPVLLCGDLPVMLFNETDQRPSFVLMPFDLHRSNLPLLTDFLLLLDGLLNETVPMLPANAVYSCGDTATLPVSGASDAAFLTMPGGERLPLQPLQGQGSVRLSTPGLYAFDQEMGGRVRVQRFFCQIPKEESLTPGALEGERVQMVHPVNGGREISRLFDPAWIMAALLILFLALEYGVYRYERL